jgi:hypothetical protein
MAKPEAATRLDARGPFIKSFETSARAGVRRCEG